MAIYIRQVHTEPTNSNQYEHITALRWNTLSDTTLKAITKEGLISWLNESSSNQAYVSVPPNVAVVKVANPNPPRSPYVHTVKDGVVTDNLLSLPRF